MAIVETKVTRHEPAAAFDAFCRAFFARNGRAPTRSEAKVLLAGAALETAFFTRCTNEGIAGVKASTSWQGDVAEHVTREFINGEWVKTKALFRAYATVYDGFADWLRLLSEGYPEALAGAAKGDPEAYVAGLLQGWGRGARYFNAPQAQYLAGVWDNLRRLEADESIPWNEGTSRRLPEGGPS
jgi:hypothetical protein